MLQNKKTILKESCDRPRVRRPPLERELTCMFKPKGVIDDIAKRKLCIGLSKNACEGDCTWIPQNCIASYDGVLNLKNTKSLTNSYI
jgi:hypothetical protein